MRRKLTIFALKLSFVRMHLLICGLSVDTIISTILHYLAEATEMARLIFLSD